ncbi:hypothetical protein DL93DRAFT_2072487 [Clavulina sp. PMI_390]|nr:hypothetical protein DL93DRAFT_2072487 [Clavulina sp. PMI_390]
MNDLEDVTDPTDFSGDAMQALERALRCAVCKDFFDSPVLLPACGHSFCSMCIRDCFLQTSKAECPSCRTTGSASSLIKNSMLEDAIFAYRVARPTLLSVFAEVEDLKQTNQRLVREGKKRELQRVASDEAASSARAAKRPKLAHNSATSSETEVVVLIDSDDATEMDVDSTGPSRSQPSSPSKKRARSPMVVDDSGDDDDDSLMLTLPPVAGSSSRAGPSTSKTRASGSLKGSKKSSSTTDTDPIVPCPICGSELPVSQMDPHIENGCASLDKQGSGSKAAAWSNLFSSAASGSGSNGTGASSSASKDKGKKKAITVITDDDPEKRDPIPKVTWSLMKEKDVRGLLEQYGLPTDGDRKKHERRYDKWILLHNASLDTARARKSLAALRKELRIWEKTVDADAAARKKNGPVDAQEHLASNKAHMDRLVAQARASMPKPQPPALPSHPGKISQQGVGDDDSAATAVPSPAQALSSSSGQVVEGTA